MYRRFARLATIDGLTAVDNRRAFDEHLEAELRNATRHEEPLALLLIDVDDFKRYNDTYGHLAGDETLQSVAAIIRSTLARPSDTIARYGGEEFAVLLPRTSASGAFTVAERIRTAVVAARRDHKTNRATHVVSISIGVAVTTTGTPDALIAAADEALYRAKAEGRNRTAIAATASPVPAAATPQPPTR
ncbi:MAG TPA: diguanylate cyclase [Candidatus Sulfotelmatobacter sp.]|nr:diguanylate cyclase [Candidatus Sulfotelmatobacter sp.]